MGNIEKEVRKRNRKANIQKVILTTIYAVGGLSVALMAPKMIKVLSKLEPEFMKNKYRKYSFNRSLARLKDEGLIIFEKTERGSFAKLTKKGIEKLRKFKIDNFKIKKPHSWDWKWRLLIFDIKEERKNTRDKIRKTLFNMGFVRLQDSVWVYPYDCEDFINLIKTDFKIGKDLLYIVADKIEGDKSLVKFFKL
ncbi:MAG: CRISPR-associated endonuclease Cas2 [Patescibacteria group bacterium]